MKPILNLIAVTFGLFAHAQEDEPRLAVTAFADYLALHVTGTAPAGATSLQYRVAESDGPESSSWTASATPPGSDGAFTLDLPLKSSRWSRVEVRALRGETVVATREVRPKPRRLEMVSAERIAALPAGEREAWASYLQRSNDRFEAEFDAMAAECRALRMPRSMPAPSAGGSFKLDGRSAAAWLVSEEGNELADVVISFQTPSGGWSKAVDYSAGPRQRGTHWTTQKGENGWHYCGTLDNRTTTEQIRFLADFYSVTHRQDAKAAALSGIEWLFAAQFPNGGWPQNYPMEPGYHEAITLNDDAMTNALEVMLDIAEGKEPFAFVDAALRVRARMAFEKGVACLVEAQVKVDGKRTVWCAQHDALTLAPVAARKKEPPSLSGLESTNLLKFFMRRAPMSSAINAMIEPALAWLDVHRVTGLRKTTNADGKTDYVPDVTSTEVYWARFYDVQTGKPMFAGAQDGIIYATYSEMITKNKAGYDYFTMKPAELLAKEATRWRKRVQSETK